MSSEVALTSRSAATLRRPMAVTTAMLLLGQGVVAATAVVTNFFSADTLGPEGRGSLALLVQLGYIAGITATLGAERPYLAWRERDFCTSLSDLACVFRPGLLLVATVLVGSLVAAPLISHEAAMWAVGAALFVAGNLSVRMARVGCIVSGQRWRYIVALLLPQGALIATSWFLHARDVATPSLWLLGYGTCFLPTILLLCRWASRSPDAGFAAQVRVMRGQGRRLLIGQLGNVLLLRADRLLLPFIGSVGQLGIYVVIATVMELAAWPAQNLADVSMRFLRGWDQFGRYALATMAIGLATLAMAVFCGFAGNLAIHSVLPAEFAPATQLIPVLALGATLAAMARFVTASLVSISATRMTAYVEVAALIVGLVAHFSLIPRYGAVGAAFGALVAQGFLLLAGMASLYRRLHPRSNMR